MPDQWRGPITLLASSRKIRRAVAVFLFASLLYALSFGPVFWTISNTGLSADAANAFYRPIFAVWSLYFFRESDSPVGYALNECWGMYANFGMSRERSFERREVEGEVYYLLP